MAAARLLRLPFALLLLLLLQQQQRAVLADAPAAAAAPTAALVIGSHEFLGKAVAHDLAQGKLYDTVYLLDDFQRERLVAPWEVYAGVGVLPGYTPTPELSADGVPVFRCDRNLECFSEILTSRTWDLVVDLTWTDTPGAGDDVDASFLEKFSGVVSHYVLVSSAAVYGSCSAGGAGLAESYGRRDECENEASAPWRALEAPLWRDTKGAKLKWTVVRVPDVMGEMEPKRSLVPFLQVFQNAANGKPLALPARLPGGKSSPFSLAHVTDVAEAVVAIATLATTGQGGSVYGEAFNIASSTTITLEGLVSDLKTVTGNAFQTIWREQNDCPFPTVRLFSPLDTSKATSALSGAWSPSDIGAWLPGLVEWSDPTKNTWYRESKKYEVNEKFSPEAQETRLAVESILYQLIDACPTDSAVQAMAQPGARDVEAARMMWTRFMYIAAPVGMVQAHWSHCLSTYELALREVAKGNVQSSWNLLGSGATAGDSKGVISANTTVLLLDVHEDWTHSLLRIFLLSGDAADADALLVAAKSLLFLSRTPTSWHWPPAVWGKACELLISAGELEPAAEVLNRALKFWSRRSIVESWELRLEDIATSLAALNANSQPQLPGSDSAEASSAGQNSTSGARPIPVLHSPSMADFVEFHAIPQMAVVITGEVDHWPSRSWRAEGRFASTCPNAAATMTYFQPQASLEFAGLAQSQRMGMAEYMKDYIVDETQLAEGARGAQGRMDVFDHPGSNRTGLSTRSPYLWDLSLHDECPEILADIRVPKFFADDLFTQGVPVIGGDSMIVWPTMMLGGAGTGSACHQDRKATPFWLAMLVGNKRVIMYSAEDAHLLYPFGMQDQGSFTTFRFDPFAPDYVTFPNARAATMYESTVKPGEILWIPPLWVHCLVNEPGEVSVKQPQLSNLADTNAAPAAVYEPRAPYAMAMVFNYHDTFSLPEFIRHCDIEKPRNDNLCMFMPSPQLVTARLSIRNNAVAAVAAGNRTRLEEVLTKVKAWGKDRWKYWEFRKVLGGRDFVRKFCDSRTGYTQSSPYLESWCRAELNPSLKKKKGKADKKKKGRGKGEL